MTFWRRLKRLFGIDAPRMSVRAAVPWYWRVLMGVMLAVLIIVLARYTYNFGRRFAGFDHVESDAEVTRLTDQFERQRAELETLRGQVAAGERQLQMERATFEDVKKQVKALSGENATLKDDLAFFQTLMPSGGKEGGVTVNRFEVVQDGQSGEYRYQVLIMQTGTRAKDFQGRLQFIVNVQQDSKRATMTLPAEGEAADQKSFRLNFRFYQRVEGSFRVEPGATVKSMQLRVFENGVAEPRLTHNANVS
ncbi:MAG: DUF6776 family protein [Burkholderiales bacterium]